MEKNLVLDLQLDSSEITKTLRLMVYVTRHNSHADRY